MDKFSEKFLKIHRKTPVLESLVKKVAGHKLGIFSEYILHTELPGDSF